MGPVLGLKALVTRIGIYALSVAYYFYSHPVAYAYVCLRRAHPNIDISLSVCFGAETRLVSTDLLPVDGVSPDLKNANVDLDCVNACFGSVIILDQGILSSAEIGRAHV